MLRLRSSLAAVAGCLLLPCLGCVAASADGRFERHFLGEAWGGALLQQTRQPAQWVPELALLAATPALANSDASLTREMHDSHAITGGKQANGDAVAVGLSLGALGLAGVGLGGGDEARSLEVLLESVLATEAATQMLKVAAHRNRPDGSGHSSFPSGHTSYAFAVATYVARGCSDLGPEWYWDLGHLAYVPAAYVGINRIEANRHFPSDVAFGAFLGVLFTNVIHDAHRGSEHHAGIHGRAHAVSWGVEPMLDPGEVGLALVCRF